MVLLGAMSLVAPVNGFGGAAGPVETQLVKVPTWTVAAASGYRIEAPATGASGPPSATTTAVVCPGRRRPACRGYLRIDVVEAANPARRVEVLTMVGPRPWRMARWRLNRDVDFVTKRVQGRPAQVTGTETSAGLHFVQWTSPEGPSVIVSATSPEVSSEQAVAIARALEPAETTVAAAHDVARPGGAAPRPSVVRDGRLYATPAADGSGRACLGIYPGTLCTVVAPDRASVVTWPDTEVVAGLAPVDAKQVRVWFDGHGPVRARLGDRSPDPRFRYWAVWSPSSNAHPTEVVMSDGAGRPVVSLDAEATPAAT